MSVIVRSLAYHLKVNVLIINKQSYTLFYYKDVFILKLNDSNDIFTRSIFFRHEEWEVFYPEEIHLIFISADILA